MSRNEYLDMLAQHITHLSKDEQLEVLYDFEEHFRIGLQIGKTEEEIASSLGNPLLIASLYRPSSTLFKRKFHFLVYKVVPTIAAVLCLAITFSTLNANGLIKKLPDIVSLQATIAATPPPPSYNLKEMIKDRVVSPDSKYTYTSINSRTEYSINVEKEFSLENVNTLTVYSPVADINFISGSDKGPAVHFYGQVTTSNGYIPGLEVIPTGNHLFIQMSDEPKNTAYDYNNLKMDIYLPKTYTKSIQATSVSKPIRISSLKLDSLACTTVSGALEIHDISSNDLIVKTTSGPIQLDSISANLKATSVSGRIDAKYTTFDHNISAKNVSGGITLELPQTAEFSLEAISVSGGINNRFPLTDSVVNKNTIMEGTVKNSRNRITTSTISGSINIKQ